MSAELDVEREAFHAWCRQHSYDVVRREGRYLNSMTALLWPLWQHARAELRQENARLRKFKPEVVTNEFLCSVGAALGEADIWKSMFHHCGPYDISVPNGDTRRFSKAVIAAYLDAALSETHGEGE